MLKASLRGLSVAFLGLGLLGVLGCQQDNEAAVKSQTGTDPLPADRPPQPKTQQEAFQQQQKQGTSSRPSGYPGPR